MLVRVVAVALARPVGQACHAVGAAAQRSLAQRGELAHGDGRPAQAADELLRLDVDELHLIRAVEHGIGNSVPGGDAGDGGNGIVQTLDVADVDRRVDIDAGLEQLVDVLTAPAVSAALRILMRQLVDKDERGPAPQRAVEVKFLLPVDVKRRQARESALECECLGRGVRGDVAHQHVDALRPGGTGGLEHRLRLADALRIAEKDLKLTLLLLGHAHHLRVCHEKPIMRTGSGVAMDQHKPGAMQPASCRFFSL